MKTFIIKRAPARDKSTLLKLVNYTGIFASDELIILQHVLSIGGYSNPSLLEAGFTNLPGERERSLTLLL